MYTSPSDTDVSKNGSASGRTFLWPGIQIEKYGKTQTVLSASFKINTIKTKNMVKNKNGILRSMYALQRVLNIFE